MLPISNQNFTWDLHLRLYWIANILAIGSFYKCSRTNSYWPKLPYGFGVDTTTSGCGLSDFPIYTKKSNFWALEQALIQLWQPQLNTPFIYQFFQLSKRAHPSYKVLELTSIWNLLVVAQTTMEVNPYASSTSSSQSNIWSPSSTLGNHSRPG